MTKPCARIWFSWHVVGRCVCLHFDSMLVYVCLHLISSFMCVREMIVVSYGAQRFGSKFSLSPFLTRRKRNRAHNRAHNAQAGPCCRRRRSILAASFSAFTAFTAVLPFIHAPYPLGRQNYDLPTSRCGDVVNVVVDVVVVVVYIRITSIRRRSHRLRPACSRVGVLCWSRQVRDGVGSEWGKNSSSFFSRRANMLQKRK